MTAAQPAETLAVHRTGRFGIVQAAIFTRDGLSPNARLTYVALTLYAGGTGQAWPSAATLAAQSGIGRSSVYRALDELEDAGIITRERRKTGTGADRPTIVTIIDEGSVPERDTTSVPERDTNKEQRTTARARASAAPPAPGAPPSHSPFDAQAAYRARAAAANTDHAAGAARARAAARRALAQGRQP